MSNTTETPNDISKVVDKMLELLETGQWSKADRLQLVLVELVKVEIAKIEAGKL